MRALSLSPSPEFAFVASNSGTTTGGHAEAVRDWPDVIELAMHHRVLPRVWRHAGAVIPEPFRGQMRAYATVNGRNALQNIERTLEALQLLEADGIPAIVLKGPLQARRLYGDFALRMNVDVDLLVREADLARAARAFDAAGYKHHTAISQRSLQRHRAFEHDVAFTHPEDAQLIELHADVAQPHYGYRVPLAEWWGSRVSTTVGGRNVAILNAEAAYLLTILHAARHQWHRLDLIADIAAFQSQDLDRQLVLSQAVAAGLFRAMHLGEALASHFYGTVPVTTGSLAFDLASQVVTGHEFGRWRGMWVDVRGRDDFPGRVTYVTQRIIRQSLRRLRSGLLFRLLLGSTFYGLPDMRHLHWA